MYKQNETIIVSFWLFILCARIWCPAMNTIHNLCVNCGIIIVAEKEFQDRNLDGLCYHLKPAVFRSFITITKMDLFFFLIGTLMQLPQLNEHLQGKFVNCCSSKNQLFYPHIGNVNGVTINGVLFGESPPHLIWVANPVSGHLCRFQPKNQKRIVQFYRHKNRFRNRYTVDV